MADSADAKPHLRELDPAERKRRLNLRLREFHGAKVRPWLTERLARHLHRPASSFRFLDLETTDALWETYGQISHATPADADAFIRWERRAGDVVDIERAFTALSTSEPGDPLVLFYDGIFERTGAVEVHTHELFAHPFDIVHEPDAEVFVAMTPNGRHAISFDYREDVYFEGVYQTVYTLSVWGQQWVSTMRDARNPFGGV